VAGCADVANDEKVRGAGGRQSAPGGRLRGAMAAPAEAEAGALDDAIGTLCGQAGRVWTRRGLAALQLRQPRATGRLRGAGGAAEMLG